MSVMSKVVEQQASRDSGRARAARVGGVVTILALALVVYGTYGDPQASDSQKSGMPSVMVGVVVVAAIVFGLLAPIALRAAEEGRDAARRWAIGLGIVSVLSVVVLWSGLPLLVGSAGALVGRTGREQTGASSAFSWAWGLGLFAAIASIVITIVGNTLH
jgi:hypothetical protein